MVASYYDPSLGRRRVNRYDHAVNSGLTAGYNMVSSLLDGTQQPYDHQPAVRSYLKDINVQCDSVGDCNGDLDTVGFWVKGSKNEDGEGSEEGGKKVFMSDVSEKSDYKRGCIYYLRGNKIVGIVLWNASDLLLRAREVLKFSGGIEGAGGGGGERAKRASFEEDGILAMNPAKWLKTATSEL